MQDGVRDDLGAAVLAVAVALDVLRVGRGPAAVVGAVDQAQAALTGLDRDATTRALEQLLVQIRSCHDSGLDGSHQLEMARRVASTAVQHDPRCTDLLPDGP